MANLFWKGEKTEFKKARLALMGEIVDLYEGNFEVTLSSDDNGSCMQLYVETDEPSKPLERYEPALAEWKKDHPKWMGWRFILIMVPKDYIEFVMNRSSREDTL